MKVLITGSSGLIGSEAVMRYDVEGHKVHGIDNNMRQEFFGPPGDTRWNLERPGIVYPKLPMPYYSFSETFSNCNCKQELPPILANSR